MHTGWYEGASKTFDSITSTGGVLCGGFLEPQDLHGGMMGRLGWNDSSDCLYLDVESQVAHVLETNWPMRGQAQCLKFLPSCYKIQGMMTGSLCTTCATKRFFSQQSPPRSRCAASALQFLECFVLGLFAGLLPSIVTQSHPPP